MPEALRCDASVVRLSSVLQVADFECLTGLVHVGEGHVAVRDGAIVGARLGRASGLDALFELFVSPGPTLAIETGVDVPAGPPLGSLMSLVIEGSRLADDWARLDAQPLAALPGAVEAARDERTAKVARKLDGARRLDGIVDRLGMLRVSVVDGLLELLEAGFVEQRVAPVAAPPVAAGVPVSSVAAGVPVSSVAAGVPPAAPAPAGPPLTAGPRAPSVAAGPRGSSVAAGVPPAAPASATPFDAALVLGRKLVREGRLAEAADAFRAALALSPGDPVAAQNLRRITLLMEQRQ